MTVERELDANDMQLLRSAAAAGAVIPKNLHQQRRLDRLDQEGYMESERRNVSEVEAPASWVYHLTRKGLRVIERPHS